jgi:opacity protein-like surface antigen
MLRFALMAGVAASALLAFGSQSQAQQALANYGKVYVGATAGVAIPQDQSITVSGGATGSGNISFKTGAAVTGLVGYHLTPNFAGELELGYAQADYDKVTGSLAAGGGSGSGSLAVKGQVSSVLGFVNGIWSPLGQGGFSPYLGAGVGFARTESKIDSVGGATVGAKGDDTFLALNGIVGADFAVTPAFSLGARYRYVWINAKQSASGSGLTVTEGDFTAHVIQATAKYRF